MAEMIDWKAYTATRPFHKCKDCAADLAPGEGAYCPACILSKDRGAPTNHPANTPSGPMAPASPGKPDSSQEGYNR